MPKWNSNGLHDELRVKTISKSKKVKAKEVEEEINLKDNIRLCEIEDLFKRRSHSARSLHLIQEYLEISLEDIIKNNVLFKDKPCYIVEVKRLHESNYLSCSIDISFYYKKDDEQYQIRDGYDAIHVELGELFKNCSSIVINRLSGERLHYSPFSNPTGREEHSKNTKDFIYKYMKLLERICEITGYSTILYTASQNETFPSLLEYLKEKYTNIKQFINKRTKHTIIFYTKDL